MSETRFRTEVAAGLRHRVLGLPIRVADVLANTSGVIAIVLTALFGGMSSTDHLHLGLFALSKGWVIVAAIVSLVASTAPTVILGWDLDRLAGHNAALRTENAELVAQEAETRGTAEKLLRVPLELMLQNNGWASDERLTLFIDHPDGEGMVAVARACLMPRYMDEGLGLTYPFGQGCLGAARSTSTPQYAVLPDPANGDAWQLELELRWGVPRRVSAAMGMRPRTFYAQRIEDVMGSGSKALAVLLLESTRTPGNAGGIAGTGRAKLEQLHLERYFLRNDKLVRSLAVHATSLYAARLVAEPRTLQSQGGRESVVRRMFKLVLPFAGIGAAG